MMGEEFESKTTFKVILAYIINIFFVFVVTPKILVDLWLWFVVPLGVVPIHHWQAFGLGIIAGLLKMTAAHTTSIEVSEVIIGKNKTWNTIANGMLIIYFAELLVWGMGYLAK